MIIQHTITSAAWTPITEAGQSAVCWLDDDNEEAGDRADVRLWHTDAGMPSADVLTNARRVTRPRNNLDHLSIKAASDQDVWYARCKNLGDTAILSVDHSGAGAQIIAGDVYIQDQHSPIVESFFARELAVTALAADAAVDSYSVTVAAGHGFTAAAGEVFVIDGYYIGRVLSVDTNTIGLDRPMNVAWPSGTVVRRGSTSLLVNGTSTPIVFKMTSVASRKFDITGVRVLFRGPSVMDYTKFGSAAALTLPLVLRQKYSDARYNNIFAARSNLELEEVCSLQISDRAPSGEYGLLADYPASESRGVVFRLNGNLDQELQLIVRGDQSATNTLIEAVAYGHVVED